MIEDDRLAPDHELDERDARALEEQPDGGPSDLRPTTPGGLAPHGTAEVALPGTNFAPEGAYAVDDAGDANVLTLATSVLVTINVPINVRLRLDGFGVATDNPANMPSLTWAILINNAPSRAYGSNSYPIGTIEDPDEIVLHAAGPCVVTVQVTNSALVTIHAVARVRGWMYAAMRRVES